MKASLSTMGLAILHELTVRKACWIFSFKRLLYIQNTITINDKFPSITGRT